jgi:hypothetical protein
MALTIMLALLAYAALQAYALSRWSGRWRLAASIPLVLMLPPAGLATSLLAQDSNLWPLPVLAATPIALLALLTLVGARRLTA